MSRAPASLHRGPEGLATLVLAAEPLSPECCAAALPLCEALAEDESLRALVIRAGSPRGAPAPWPLPSRATSLEALRPLRALVGAVAALPMPVLAVLEGAVVAEALELALACDLRLASAAATFAMPQLAEGRLPCCGGSQRLPRLVGLSAAYELFLGAEWSAARAEALGLVTAVVPGTALAAEATRWAARLAAKSPFAARFLKEAVRRGLEVPLDQALLIEEDLYLLLQTTGDRKEGIRAFLAKRTPRFKGT